MLQTIDNHFILDRGASVHYHLAFARQWLDDAEVTEICVNRPFEVFCERQNVWQRHDVPDLTQDHLQSLATAMAKFVGQDISETQPLLSAVMPKGERIQLVLPPACEPGTVSLTIRKPSAQVRTLSEYETQGFFKYIKPLATALTDQEQELLHLKQEQNFLEFLRRAVQLEKVIVVAGETGSGKTTFMKSLVQEIPTDQRIITIEDVPELLLPNHPNHVHLFYPSEAREEDNAPVTAAVLLKSCLRMKPTRILLAEVRSGETFDFINIAASGHGGSMTSCHAGSCDLAFERLALMILQNRQGRTLPYDVIRHLLYMMVDVVVHVHNDVSSGKGRHITELWYDPIKKRAQTLEKQDAVDDNTA